eukprot:COSAG06_NODE_5737_length_3300_cov_6.881287_5_plen_189_part_00
MGVKEGIDAIAAQSLMLRNLYDGERRLLKDALDYISKRGSLKEKLRSCDMDRLYMSEAIILVLRKYGLWAAKFTELSQDRRQQLISDMDALMSQSSVQDIRFSREWLNIFAPKAPDAPQRTYYQLCEGICDVVMKKKMSEGADYAEDAETWLQLYTAGMSTNEVAQRLYSAAFSQQPEPGASATVTLP